MVLNGSFDPLWLNADVSLSNGGGTVLQESLDNGDTINELDKTTDEIMDLLGNPDQVDGFMRRGLCIGDVQSGKTSTYIVGLTKVKCRKEAERAAAV